MYKRKKGDKRKKLKTSDENLTTAEYTALNESVRILVGTGDPLEDLKRMVLMQRLEAGIDRPIEDLGFIRDDD